MAMSMKQDTGNVLSRVSYLFHPLWYLGLSNGDVVDRSECLTADSQLFMNRLQHLLSWSHCIGCWDMFNWSCWNIRQIGILATGYQLLIPTNGVFSSSTSSVLQLLKYMNVKTQQTNTVATLSIQIKNNVGLRGESYSTARLLPLAHCLVAD